MERQLDPQALEEVGLLAQAFLVALDQVPPQLGVSARPGRVALAAMVAAAVAIRRAGLTLGEARACWRVARGLARDLAGSPDNLPDNLPDNPGDGSTPGA